MTIYEDTNSTYDLNLKLAIPTLEYIKSITGYNLEILGGSNTIETQQRVKGLTLDAKDDLYARIPLKQDKNVMDYLIATDENWRRDFIRYVVMYVKETFLNPDDNEMSIRVKRIIESSLLNARQFTPSLRYEVLEAEW